MTFREEIYALMKRVPSWSQCSDLYKAVRADKPFINANIMNLFVNNIWATTSFASSQCALDAATSLFLWCPADRHSTVFKEKEDEVFKAGMAARLGTNKGKAGGDVPLLARCTCLLDVVSALLHMSAAARLCCEEVGDHAPALPWLLDFAASTIATEDIEDTFSDQASREELLSHYLLHELQEIFRAYVRGATHYRQRAMADKYNCVLSSTWTTAARAIMNLPHRIDVLVSSDLKATGLVTLKRDKPIEKVTQVKQVSHSIYTTSEKGKQKYTNFFTCSLFPFRNNKNNKRKNPSQVLQRLGTAKIVTILTRHKNAPQGIQASSRRSILTTTIMIAGERCLRNGPSALCAECTPQRLFFASLGLVVSSTMAAEVPINPGPTCQLTHKPRCGRG